VLIYIITFVISLLFFFIGDRLYRDYRWLFYLIAITPPAILAGCRDLSVGTDTSLYQYPTFLTCVHSHTLERAFNYTIQGLESLYIMLAYFISCFTSNHNVFFFVTHLVILSSLLFAFYRSRVEVATAFSLFYPMFFAETLNVARQCLAMPFCLLSLAEFRRKKYLGCFSYFLIAFGFHHSSWFFLLVLFLYHMCKNHYRRMKQKSMVIILVSVVSLAVVLFNVILTSLVGIGIADVKYLERYGNADMYGSGAPVSLFAMNTFNLMIWLIFFYNRRKSPFVVFSFYVMLISLLLCFTGYISTFAIRLAFYFMIVSIVSISFLMVRSIFIFRIIIYTFYMFYWFMIVVVADLGETYPYQSKIIDSIF